MSSSSGYFSDISQDGLKNNSSHSSNGNQDSCKGSTAVQNSLSLMHGRKRSLPIPPATEPPKKNFAQRFQSCKELYSKFFGYSRLIVGITLSVLAAAALGVVIYRVLTIQRGSEFSPPDNATDIPQEDTTVHEGDNGTMNFFMTSVQNPESLDLLQESIGQNLTILHNIKLNFTERTWSLDGREISIGISNTDKGSFQILLNVDVSNSQCRHSGKYFVLLYGSNGKAEQSRSYNVAAACPCKAEYEVISGSVLECQLKVIGRTAVRFDKVSGENIRPILNQTGIRIPDNVPETNLFSATWKPDGTLITRIYFSPVQCHDEGNYSLTVTSQAGTKVHYIYVDVIDFPKDPTIRIPSGLIGNRSSDVECLASTGCKKANITAEATDTNSKQFYSWARNVTQQHYQEGGIWKAKVTWTFSVFEVNTLLDNRFLRCTYYIDGKKFYSQAICMKTVPGNFCLYKTATCSYPHPYDCNKYITCTTIPEEMHCIPGLHFPNTVNCNENCAWPYEAKCNIQRMNGGYCGDT